jgi:DNA-binding NtrC family response regulator
MKSAAQMQLVDGTTAVVRSEPMRKLMAMVERVAQHDAAVLIVGETGVGKEMVAKAIHRHSLRCGKAFVDVNCAALPEHLVESELFGYEKGAFSGADATKPGLFELADQGTLLLDEIGELDGKVQAKLLRVLDGVPYYRLGGSRKVAVNVRVIAATNRDLEEEIGSGKFRRDLFHRLNQFTLVVPPLRERRDDIVPIAEFFLRQHAPTASFSEEAKEALLLYDWPGNVRELKSVVQRAAILAIDPEIRSEDLPAEVVLCGQSPPASSAAETLRRRLLLLEREHALKVLSQCSGNVTETARRLGVSRMTIYRKIRNWQVSLAGPRQR